MNRTFKITLMLLFISLFSFSLFAQEAEKVTETKKLSENLILEHTYEKGSVGSFDKLVIEKDGKKTVIFESEGRKIKEVTPIEDYSEGKPAYIVSMDCGGSGGYYDIAFIQPKGDVWTSAWEDSFAQPKLKIDKKDDKAILVIDYFEIENDKPVKKQSKLDLSTTTLIK